MRVRMLVQVTGPRNGADWPAPGDTIEVDDLEGELLIGAGIAAGDVLLETATDATPVETATVKSRKR